MLGACESEREQSKTLFVLNWVGVREREGYRRGRECFNKLNSTAIMWYYIALGFIYLSLKI